MAIQLRQLARGQGAHGGVPGGIDLLPIPVAEGEVIQNHRAEILASDSGTDQPREPLQRGRTTEQAPDASIRGKARPSLSKEHARLPAICPR